MDLENATDKKQRISIDMGLIMLFKYGIDGQDARGEGGTVVIISAGLAMK